MKTYYINISEKSSYWQRGTYIVKAESETEALEKLKRNDSDIDHAGDCTIEYDTEELIERDYEDDLEITLNED